MAYGTLLVLCGILMFGLEVALAQYSGLGSVQIFQRAVPLFCGALSFDDSATGVSMDDEEEEVRCAGVGWSMLALSGVACLTANTLLSWVLHYCAASARALGALLVARHDA